MTTSSFRNSRLPGCALVLALFLALPAGAKEFPLGRNATAIRGSHAYLQAHPAPDYWALSPHYVAQITDSACSLAAVAMVINALRGRPDSDGRLVTQTSLLRTVGSDDWAKATAEKGPGVTLAQFEAYLAQSLRSYGLETRIETIKPDGDSVPNLEQLRRVLTENERSANDIVLVYYNQGVVTGDWDGPHISPIGAYDAENRRVLILDVDREWYGPYWTSDETLLASLLRPAPANMGKLWGETGALLHISVQNKPSNNR
jgi:hypothetical protein